VKYFEGQPVNIVTREGQPWFRGSDVASRLGYALPHKAINNHVEAADRVSIQNGTKIGRLSIYINESGPYALILGSKKPEARRFKHWVTKDVLPSIRKTGGYNQENFNIQEIITQTAQAVVEASH
jgi:anti-repressor protein